MADFDIRNHGSVVAFRPITDAAREWVDENVQSDGWQWLGPSLVVDHRYAGALIEGIIGAGFEIEE